jgi:hypothetical protein
MTEVFDTYTKKTIAYYIFIGIMTVPILLFALTNIFLRFHLSQIYERYLGFIACLGLAIFLAFRNSFLKMYIKDGEISFSSTSISVNSALIQLNQINKIVIKANDYKGNQRGTSDGSGNRIEIYEQAGKIYICRFVIKSYFDLNDLKKILADYTETGLTITSNGF